MPHPLPAFPLAGWSDFADRWIAYEDNRDACCKIKINRWFQTAGFFIQPPETIMHLSPYFLVLVLFVLFSVLSGTGRCRISASAQSSNLKKSSIAKRNLSNFKRNPMFICCCMYSISRVRKALLNGLGGCCSKNVANCWFNWFEIFISILCVYYCITIIAPKSVQLWKLIQIVIYVNKTGAVFHTVRVGTFYSFLLTDCHSVHPLSLRHAKS